MVPPDEIREFRCRHCGALIFKGYLKSGSVVVHKCSKCNTYTTFGDDHARRQLQTDSTKRDLLLE